MKFSMCNFFLKMCWLDLSCLNGVFVFSLCWLMLGLIMKE